jgi:hypothetical protein
MSLIGECLTRLGFGDNVAIKFYINNPSNKGLLDSIQKKFADAKTIGGKILSEYQDQIEKHIEDRLISDFYLGLNKLDSNLQEYIFLLVRSVIMLESTDFRDKFASDHFGGYLHKILETIIKIDKEKRSDIYLEVYNRFDIDYKSRKNALIGVWKLKVLSRETFVPDKLSGVCNNSLKFAASLKGHIVGFALTYMISNKSPLLKLFNNRITEIIEISDFRNIDSHGQTSNEKP